MVTEEHKLVIYTILIDMVYISGEDTRGWGVGRSFRWENKFALPIWERGRKVFPLESIHTLFISRNIEGGLGCQRMSIFFALNLCNI